VDVHRVFDVPRIAAGHACGHRQAGARATAEDPNAPSEGLHYADKAIRCLERIQHNDTQRARAHRRVKHWLQMHRA
jgi:hypothetical protein